MKNNEDKATGTDHITSASDHVKMRHAKFEIDGDGTVLQHLGGGQDDRVLHARNLVGRRFIDVWPGSAAELISQYICRALNLQSDQSFMLKLETESGSYLYEVRLLVKGHDRLVSIFRNCSTDSNKTGRPSFAGALTSLTTRARFIARLETLLVNAQLSERGLALMCIDIDGFTRINDTVGRSAGDAFLKATTRLIQGCFREADHLVQLEQEFDGLTRAGSDEFVLVLTGTQSRADIDTVADRIQQAFTKPMLHEKHALRITPRIGIAQFPADGSDAEMLFAKAQYALDAAKTHEKNGRAFYSGTGKLQALKGFDQKDELRQALEKNQLDLHYLPRIDLTSGQVIGLEALLRWIHPVRGSVPLREIIPFAEVTGLMLPIGEWVVDTACKHAKSWSNHGDKSPVVSINLSRQEFARDDLPELIAKSLGRHELPGSRLQLDLTEIIIMQHARASRVLAELKRLGIRLVIDDFGTGHSSLVRLKSLPIDALKIDRSFVEGIEAGGDKRAICGAIIALARELGFRVIAEGVESDAQLAFLQMRGCHAAQGFFYSRPLPSDAVIGFLEAWAHSSKYTSMMSLESIRERVAH